MVRDLAEADVEPNDGRRRAGQPWGRLVLVASAGGLVGALGWVGLSVPQHLINVIFSVLVGVGAGVGAGRLSGSPRSWRTVVIALVVTVVVLLPTQGWITRQYQSWATDALGGTPVDPSWDGPLGLIRLALDRAAGRKGWTSNASYFWWTMSLIAAGWLGWSTAPKGGSSPRS